MKNAQAIPAKLHTLDTLLYEIHRWHFLSQKVVFTNGCFDILHRGHIRILSEAASHGDKLIVAVNTDASVKKLKGEQRPLNNESDRALLLAALEVVDAVILFGEDTPLELINALQPDVLVKGGDYTIDQIVGAKETMARGGKVEIVPFEKGYSTTGLIDKIHRL